MNYKLAMVPLLLCGMLASCNDSEELIQKNPDFVEAGYPKRERWVIHW